MTSIFFDKHDEDELHEPTSTTAKIWKKEDVLLLMSQDSNKVAFIDIKSKAEVYRLFKQVTIEGKNQNFVACNTCKTVYAWTSGGGNTSLHRHCCETSNVKRGNNKPVSNTVDRYVRKTVPPASIHQLNKSVTFGLLKDMKCLHSIEGIGFKHMAQALINFGAKYGYQQVQDCIQHRTTLKRTHVPELCADGRAEIKELLKSAPPNYKYSFSKDMWSEKYNKRNFLSVTLHYINDDWEKLPITLGLDEVIQKKTTEHLREKCTEMLGLYFDTSMVPDIMENAFSVTDGGSNMIHLFNNHLSCKCHELNLFVDWTLNDRKVPTDKEIAEAVAKGKPIKEKKLFNLETHCPIIQKSLTAVKDLVKYYKQSALNSKLPKTLKQNVDTRWDSELIMLKSYVEVKSEVTAMLLENRQFARLVNIDDDIVQELITFLEPVRICSKALSGDKYPTIHLVAPSLHLLKLNIAIKEADSEEIKILKKQAALCFDEYLTVNTFCYMACLLHPKYRQLHFAKPEEREQAIRLLKLLVDEQISNEKSLIEQTSMEPSASAAKSKKSSRFQQFEDVQDTDDEHVGISEVDRYLVHRFALKKYEDEDGNFQILSFWKDCTEFPNIKKVARFILAVPAAETTDERNFSSTGQILTPRRTAISGGSLCDFLFIHKSVSQPKL